jgi:hypothetical protein
MASQKLLLIFKENKMLRKINRTDCVGKTIESINNDCVNVLTLIFTDKSTLELCAEDAVCVSAGTIPGIFVEDSLPENR